MSELPRTIATAAEALRNGSVSAVSLTETLLARAHAANGKLGAFIQIADETALAAARQADADFAAGIDRGPLQGIPLAIKDIIATEDAPTTANSRVMDPSWGQRDIGPMAHTVWDCAAMLQVMAGYDPKYPSTVDRPVPEMLGLMDGSLEGVRIGVPTERFFTAPGLEPEVKAGVLGAIEAMRAAGATVVEVRVRYAAEAQHALWATMGSEALAYHEPDLRSKPELYGRHTREALLVGMLYTGADFVQAQRVRAIVKAGCLALFRPALGADGDGVDVLITPSRPTVAPLLEGYDTDFLFLGTNFSGIWNVTGQPALCVPCGFSPTTGMPLSMQIVGRPFDEPTVFKVGDAYQRMTDWHLRAPKRVWEAQPA